MCSSTIQGQTLLAVPCLVSPPTLFVHVDILFKSLKLSEVPGNGFDIQEGSSLLHQADNLQCTDLTCTTQMIWNVSATVVLLGQLAL